MVKNKPGQNGYNVAMYYSCIRNPEKLQEYYDEMYASINVTRLSYLRFVVYVFLRCFDDWNKF